MSHSRVLMARPRINDQTRGQNTSRVTSGNYSDTQSRFEAAFHETIGFVRFRSIFLVLEVMNRRYIRAALQRALYY